MMRGPAHPAVLAYMRSRVESAFSIVDRHLAERRFMLGDRPTIVDFSLAGYLYYPTEETGFLPRHFPRLMQGAGAPHAAGRAACPAASPCRRPRWSIPRPRASCPSPTRRRSSAPRGIQGQAHDLLLRWRHLGHDRPVPAAPARPRRNHALRRLHGRVGEDGVAADRDRLSWGRATPQAK